MYKDFDSWNKLKKRINMTERVIFCNPGEIWWCTMGLNIGSEEDGKNHLFEGPVIIAKVFNKHMVRIIPLTSKIKNDHDHFIISYQGVTNSASLSHLRTISPLSLTRKLGRLDEHQFENLIQKLLKSIT
jgi:mRNA-degrading endonuclease toxin of MazEF toxin-antitoxin module